METLEMTQEENDDALPEPNGEYIQIMVLNDGGTFTDLSGCMIVSVPDNWSTDDIESALMDEDSRLVIVQEF
jgi:hypothetical protein